MLQGVSKIIYDLVIRHPLACRQHFYFSVVDVSVTQSTVCFKLFVKNFLPPVCSPLGPVCINKIRRPESEKTQWQKCSKIENGISEFWNGRRKSFLNGDFVSEKIKICHSVSDVSLKLPPKIRFCKVVLENQVCRGLKCL